MIDAVFLPPTAMDQSMIGDLIENLVWKPVNHLKTRYVESFDKSKSEDIILVLPGAYHKVEDINREIKRFKSVLVIIVSDENNLFPVNELKHPHMKLWVQTPKTNATYPKGTRFFGVGYGFGHMHGARIRPLDHPKDIFISGQDTHQRRHFIFDELDRYEKEHPELEYFINRTKGFTQGYSEEMYFNLMNQTKIAPAPSGVVSPDSFRVYEALECGVIPIADDISPAYNSKGYWAKLFPDTPMPILGDDDIHSIISTELDNFNWRSIQIYAWWQQQKREYAYQLRDDVLFLKLSRGGYVEKKSLKSTDVPVSDRITAIIPVSPWASHPDTLILEETIRNTQTQLPGAEIIVTFDGVREEQEDRRADYEAFVKKMLRKMNFEYDNVLPIVFKEHTHQVGMAREALKYVKTETIIYIEGDSPLYTDRLIEWDELIKDIEWGDANVIRLYNKEVIPPEHEYLMHHEFDVPRLNLIATSQWSQQPHLASTNFYREIVDKYFTSEAKCFVEERMYYIIASESRNGQWSKWRMFIYKPDNLPRSYHLDGREGASNFYEKQVF